MATLAVLEQAVVDEIGSINRTDDSVKLKRYANQGVRDILLKTGVKVVTDTLSVTAGTADYTLDSDIMVVKAAYFTGERPLEQVSPDEIDNLRVGAAVAAAVTRFALEGTDLLMLYPTPAAAGTLNLRIVKRPTELSSDAHDPADATYGGIPIEFHPVLIDYMCWKAGSFDDDQSSAQGSRYKEFYEQGLRDIRRYVNGKGGVRLPRARVGRRRFFPSRNDIYPSW